ncbi:MAG: glycosyltransferase family 2 protein [Anaerolineae bacterium]|nr:glycosyltransferase family 2 protein [Anaerolineae bacterium]
MSSPAPPLLSIIVPAYNEETRLPDTMRTIEDHLTAQSFSSEVLVIENGSQDSTLSIAQEFAASHPRFRVIHETARGKGLAVRRGMLSAQGDYRFMCDADLSMPIEEVNRFLPPLAPEADIIIGSREAPGAVRYNEPSYRHMGGRFVNTLIRWTILPGLQDTQCGFKCFSAAAAEDLFRLQTINGWSFDIELLYAARLRGYTIAELPVPWYFSPESHVQPIKDTIRLSLDILDIRRNARRGLYGSPH